jgi:hypothetical protein
MSNLLFIRRCFAYRHAARMELHRARMLPPGPERNEARKLVMALRDLARNEAWLEGQTMRTPRNEVRFAIGEAPTQQIRRVHGHGGKPDQTVAANCAAPVQQNFVIPTEGHCGGD